MSDMPSMPVSTASISWVDSGGTPHIRVYSCDGYNVIERCTDGGSNSWYTGEFTAPGEAVSAAIWQDSSGAHLRVYCTFEDKTVEYCNDPSTGWTQGSFTTQ
jgi:hypothetical protein